MQCLCVVFFIRYTSEQPVNIPLSVYIHVSVFVRAKGNKLRFWTSCLNLQKGQLIEDLHDFLNFSYCNLHMNFIIQQKSPIPLLKSSKRVCCVSVHFCKQFLTIFWFRMWKPRMWKSSIALLVYLQLPKISSYFMNLDALVTSAQNSK